ncbi:MAG: PadR family transcriptional regulator [Ardenticatenaceae bacterium]|nr:PadR family transcriptional regulator [Ardenticatenaceae bacterium]HBY98660.1 hypothetical protein [Chloroflexota bacterium]
MPVRHAILGLLARRPMHGYEIDSEFEKGLRQFCHVNISQIYAYLKSLEERGWVNSETILQERNPPKKVYSLTPAGRAELLHWLVAPVLRERQIRDEFLTKLFFCHHVAPATLHELVAQQKAVYQEHLQEILAAGQEPMDFLTRLLYEAGRRHAEADVEWLDWVEEQIKYYGDNPTPAPLGDSEPAAGSD